MSTPDTGPSAVKASARAEARSRRRTGPAPDPAGLAHRTLELLEAIPGPMRVTCYASYGTEPSTQAMRALLARAGFEVLLPRVVDNLMEWVVDGEATVTSPMGIQEPTGPAVALQPVRALLIPALSVTPNGDRLGKGGGFYDRALADLASPRPALIAIVGDGDVVSSVPMQEHDRRVDYVVTPTRTIDCAASGG